MSWEHYYNVLGWLTESYKQQSGARMPICRRRLLFRQRTPAADTHTHINLSASGVLSTRGAHMSWYCTYNQSSVVRYIYGLNAWRCATGPRQQIVIARAQNMYMWRMRPPNKKVCTVRGDSCVLVHKSNVTCGGKTTPRCWWRLRPGVRPTDQPTGERVCVKQPESLVWYVCTITVVFRVCLFRVRFRSCTSLTSSRGVYIDPCSGAMVCEHMEYIFTNLYFDQSESSNLKLIRSPFIPPTAAWPQWHCMMHTLWDHPLSY